MVTYTKPQQRRLDIIESKLVHKTPLDMPLSLQQEILPQTEVKDSLISLPVPSTAV